MRHRLLTTCALTLAAALAVAPGPRADALTAATPPVITVDVRASDGQGAWVGWYKDNVSAVLRATDDDGIARLSYRLTGAQTGDGSIVGALLPVTISAEGLTTIEITATDTAGNTATRSYGVGIDRTDPTAGAVNLSRESGVPRNENRAVDYSCADPGGPASAIVSCTATHDGIPFTSGSRIDTSQAGTHTLVVTAKDRVGRTALETVTYQITRYALTRPPMIEGNPTVIKVGQQLRASVGFEPTPGALNYAWYIDGVHASNQATFTPAGSHRGKRISLRVVCSDGPPDFSNTTRPLPTAEILVQDDLQVTRQPTITGDPATVRPGAVLTATDATFTPIPSSITYRWYADGQQVGTGREYRVQPVDAGKTIAMDAFAVSADANYLDTVSARVGSVKVGPNSFDDQTSPVVAGIADVGGTLTITDGTVSPTTPPAGSHWTVDGAVVATGNRFTLTRAHAGRVVACNQLFTRPGYADLVLPCTFPGGATSVTIPGTRAGGPGSDTAWTVTSPARIKGKAEPGKTLRAVLPQLTGPAASYSYQWLRNGKAIKKATTATYKVRKNDRKRKVTVRITATSPTGGVVVSTAKALRVSR
ncbi:hypothetical protein [Nocardioides nitrophenolicus]|uniref:hypothetical protein n=1 Tax=Nocardioides nitrophenolicus TaxID=60489 RepID=UPI00195C9C6E|nr:hypothetical protein [Nocardioides nitrophenolicus]MBM7518385.1 hypothetical protein [Nocardioides nitrophenolicus]